MCAVFFEDLGNLPKTVYSRILNGVLYLHDKCRLDCGVFSANRIDQIEPLLSQPHKGTYLQVIK